jgi:hypothetical protein
MAKLEVIKENTFREQMAKLEAIKERLQGPLNKV